MQVSSDQTLETSVLPVVAELFVRNVEKDLLQSESVALSIDGWDGDGLLGKVAGVVYHWVDKSFVLRHSLLDLISVTGNETG